MAELNASERKTLADLDYIARKFFAINLSSQLTERLRLFSVALVENTYKQSPDPNKAELVSIMAATPDGIYWRNLRDENGENLLDRLARDLGVTIYAWSPPTPQPAPAPQPAPSPAPTPAPTPTPAPAPSGSLDQAQLDAIVAEVSRRVIASLSSSASMIAAEPEAFQWPRAENNYSAPAGSGAPAGKLAPLHLVEGGLLVIANRALRAGDPNSGPNQQPMGIGNRSQGKLRVGVRDLINGDGGMRDITNYAPLDERAGVGTVSRRGWDIFCSVPDAISINSAVWTTKPDGKRDAGVFIVKRIDANHFIGNWNDPAMDYENRAFTVTGADQPDRDKFSIKSGADGGNSYGWRIDKPRNSPEAHAPYEQGGYDDKGDFLVILRHDNASMDIGRYSRYFSYCRGRGIRWATSVGNYSECADAFGIEPGANGAAGHAVMRAVGTELRVVRARDDGTLYLAERAPMQSIYDELR